jgi:hypothetical protein
LSGFNPKVASTCGTFQVVAAFHLSEPRPQVFDLPTVEQSVESGDSGRTSDEELNPTGIASYVWFLLLRDPHLSRIRAYRARKHLLSA